MIGIVPELEMMDQWGRHCNRFLKALLRWWPLWLFFLGVILLQQSGFSSHSLQEGLQERPDRAPLLFVASGVVLMSLLIPKTAISLCAGSLFGTADGCLLMLVTAILAAALNYWMGTQLRGSVAGRRVADRSDQAGTGVRGRLERTALAFDGWAKTAGPGVHSLIRFSPLPCWLISYSMGIAGARFWPYLAGATAGVLPQFLYVHAAALAQRGSATESERWIAGALSLALACLVTILLARMGASRLRDLRNANDCEAMVSPTR